AGKVSRIGIAGDVDLTRRWLERKAEQWGPGIARQIALIAAAAQVGSLFKRGQARIQARDESILRRRRAGSPTGECALSAAAGAREVAGRRVAGDVDFVRS